MNEVIVKAKKEYMDIGKVFCPYLNDYVHFTMMGFTHLVRNNSGKRNKKNIYGRLSSIKHVSEIVSKSGTLQEYENINTEYFAFISILKHNKYKVVVLKDRGGKYKFISVIPGFKTSPARDTLKTYPKNG